MTLLLNDEDVLSLLPMSECIDAMERCMGELSAGVAVNPPRVRFAVPVRQRADARYWMNVHCGAFPGGGVACLRLVSNLREDTVEGGRRMQFHKPEPRNWGQVLLYDIETSELLAILPSFTLSALRVGATTGLGVRRLSVAGPVTFGLIGAGHQARTNLQAVAAAVEVRAAKVFSPNPAHRRAFADEMSRSLPFEVRAVDSAREAVEGSEVVSCATNASEPVLKGEWLTAGQLVTSIVNSDVIERRDEVDAETFRRADLIAINDRPSVEANRQVELLGHIAEGVFTWDKVCELGEVVIGRHPGRRSDNEIVYYKNNTGLAIQFAAAGGVIYHKARERGIGRELPGEWFSTDLSAQYAAGYYPGS